MTLIMSVVSRSSVADQINFCKNSCILMKLSGTKNTVFHINHYFNMLKGTLLPSQLKPVSFDCLFLSSHLSPVLLHVKLAPKFLPQLQVPELRDFKL